MEFVDILSLLSAQFSQLYSQYILPVLSLYLLNPLVPLSAFRPGGRKNVARFFGHKRKRRELFQRTSMDSDKTQSGVRQINQLKLRQWLRSSLQVRPEFSRGSLSRPERHYISPKPRLDMARDLSTAVSNNLYRRRKVRGEDYSDLIVVYDHKYVMRLQFR